MWYPFIGFIDLAEPDGVLFRFCYRDQIYTQREERSEPLSAFEAFQQTDGDICIRRKDPRTL